MSGSVRMDELLARIAEAAGLIGLAAEQMPSHVIEVKSDYRSEWAYEITIKERRIKQSDQ